MDAIQTYVWGNLGWQSLQGVSLVIFPKFISNLLRPESHVASSLEDYFARSLGFSLIVEALIVVVLSGAVPLTSAADVSPDTASPYASAVLLLSAVHNAFSAAYCWSRFYSTSQTGYMFGCIGSAILGVYGLWCMMFAGDKSRISRYHHFDKHTSGFPFKNSESYRSKKRDL